MGTDFHWEGRKEVWAIVEGVMRSREDFLVWGSHEHISKLK